MPFGVRRRQPGLTACLGGQQQHETAKEAQGVVDAKDNDL